MLFKDEDGKSGLSYLRGHLTDGKGGVSPEEYTKEVIAWIQRLIKDFEEKYREMGMTPDRNVARPSLLFDDDDDESNNMELTPSSKVRNINSTQQRECDDSQNIRPTS